MSNLKLINMQDIEVEAISWLWYPFIPYGKVTIIQGDPGEGKTTLVLQIIASSQERKRMNHPATVAVPMIMIAATIPISMLMRSPFFRRSSDLAKPYRYSTI